jgi:Tfp pilus assembly protein PilZ
MKKKLRRRFKRIPSNIKIEYKPKYSPKGLFFKGKVLNLSADGVYVFSKHLFSIGDILTVRMHLLPEPGLLEVEAKVIWLADRQLQPHEFPGMAIEFYKIEPELQEKIVKFVEKHITRSVQDNPEKS